MRLYILLILLLFFATANGQDKDSLTVKDTIVPITNTLPNPRGLNMYGDLLDDDPAYNKKYSWWIPAARVVAADAFNWAIARYMYDFEWARVNSSTWKDNLKHGFEWDVDNFGINFIGHPHTGNYYYNIARSNGYSFYETIPFTIGGSLVWEYFGENTRPSLNDIINTPISGMFLGEIFYRISSNVLNDRLRGRKRVWRELLAGIINPPRALNRLTQGKMGRVIPVEVYQKEPLNVLVNAGAHRVNELTKFGTGSTNVILNFQLDYGNPFETRKRKPYDVFRLRTELSYGANRKLLENVNGYGLLFGSTIKKGRLLGGGFQHFDYWNNNIFEVGSLGFGGGLISRIPVAKHSNIYSNIHLAIVPLAGNNTRFGPDTSEFRRYNFGGGFQGKLEETFNLNDWASVGATAFYYWIHTYDGLPGNSLVGILRPFVTIKLIKNLSIGFEHHIYKNDRFLNDIPNLHLTRSEQKVFLQFFFEDKQRSGKYH